MLLNSATFTTIPPHKSHLQTTQNHLTNYRNTPHIPATYTTEPYRNKHHTCLFPHSISQTPSTKEHKYKLKVPKDTIEWNTVSPAHSGGRCMGRKGRRWLYYIKQSGEEQCIPPFPRCSGVAGGTEQRNINPIFKELHVGRERKRGRERQIDRHFELSSPFAFISLIDNCNVAWSPSSKWVLRDARWVDRWGVKGLPSSSHSQVCWRGLG